MLVVGSKLVGAPVMSVHVGGEIARAKMAIIEPENLKVVAYELTGALLRGIPEKILRTEDVREFGRLGLIIDSRDELVAREDVVRIDEILKLNFSLVGLKVVTKKGKKLGKVSDYLVETGDFSVQKIIVQRPTMKSLLDPELTIDRVEIVEVDDYKIVVKDEEAKLKAKEKKAEFIPNFVNPFREPVFETIRNRSPGEQDIE